MARLLITDVTITKNDGTITCGLRLRGGQEHTLALPALKPPGNCAARRNCLQAGEALDEVARFFTRHLS
jgi:hypothetical protein